MQATCIFNPFWMGKKEEKMAVEWVVVNELPGLVFEVQLPEGSWWWIIEAYLWGKMKKNLIKPIIGDTVTVELSFYDLTKWRIIFRSNAG